MSKLRVAKLEVELAAAEAAFRNDLLRLLPQGADSGVDFFSFAELGAHAQRNTHSTSLLAAARRCLELRSALSLPAAGSLSQAYISACEESASGDPHRRGPRKLAQSLLLLAAQPLD